MKNAIRLLSDAMLLFKHDSFPSAFQLAVLSLEEFAKSNWVEHYWFASKTNNGFPDKDFEQEWLFALYSHTMKHTVFSAQWSSFISEEFYQFLRKGDLDQKKQIATYVGLKRYKREINVNSRISKPTSIKERDAKDLIALLVDNMKFYYTHMKEQGFYFDISEKDDLLTDYLFAKLDLWKYRVPSKIKREIRK